MSIEVKGFTWLLWSWCWARVFNVLWGNEENGSFCWLARELATEFELP